MVTRISLMLFTTFVVLVNSLAAQEPFICDGNSYVVLRNEIFRQSKLFQISNNADLSEIIFEEVGPDSVGGYLNCIGYRKTDNFIYGIDPLSSDLYKVDKNGTGFFLDNIHELDTLCAYIAGEVSLNGESLILVEQCRVDDRPVDAALVFIDLTDPEFTVTRVEIIDEEQVLGPTADVAIHPFNNLMYGYDLINDKLTTYDLETGIASSDNFLTNASQPGSLGALFFDEFGRLLGYGREQDSLFQNTLFELDINTGLAEILENGPIARGTDGCSCVSRVGMKKTVWPTQAFPCTEVDYTLQIANATGETVENMLLVDTLNSNLEFLELKYNPFSSNFSFDTINNVFQLSNLTLPPGIDSIVFTVFVKKTTPSGRINNQAQLTNLPSGQESILYSDYPVTLERGDPTPLEILEALEVNEIYYDTIICLGEPITLVSQFPNGEYTWEGFNEEQTDRLEIQSGGTYVLTTVTGCREITETFQVGEESISFSLGADQNVDLGESIQISPTVRSTSINNIYEWIGNDPAICLDCPAQNFIPLENQIISLSITNQSGCVSQDSITILVNKDRSVFIPNAFSPNGDGINDLIFANTKIPQQILYFRIYNRWGALVFQNEDGLTNDATFGWNGDFKGETVNDGTFIFDMLLLYPDGVEQQISGDITVIK